MEYTEKDQELFKALNKSETGLSLLDLLERFKANIFNPKDLTPENLVGKKEAVFTLEELCQKIRNVNPEINKDNNQYI